ncbi:symporter small accessory protein [Desulfuromonas sp.]|uniref:symporter small accessory protein n=1 Tax=Desulfuromonas sp. TaxID=892 RepID=UPI0025BB944A|nr:symporter small accessory protein [Desulfuromonas sp.]
MLGLEGLGVPAGFALTLLSALLCIWYGVKNWNRGHLSDDEARRKQAWAREEQKVEENL